MERVSFEVAKYLKEVGYPQGWDSEVHYSLEDEGEYGYKIGDEVSVRQVYKRALTSVAAPFYMDVWLWLWRIKNIKIKPIDNFATYVQGFEDELQFEGHSDPEEAVKQAIEYLIKNNMIK